MFDPSSGGCVGPNISTCRCFIGIVAAWWGETEIASWRVTIGKFREESIAADQIVCSIWCVATVPDLVETLLVGAGLGYCCTAGFKIVAVGDIRGLVVTDEVSWYSTCLSECPAWLIICISCKAGGVESIGKTDGVGISESDSVTIGVTPQRLHYRLYSISVVLEEEIFKRINVIVHDNGTFIAGRSEIDSVGFNLHNVGIELSLVDCDAITSHPFLI